MIIISIIIISIVIYLFPFNRLRVMLNFFKNSNVQTLDSKALFGNVEFKSKTGKESRLIIT